MSAALLLTRHKRSTLQVRAFAGEVDCRAGFPLQLMTGLFSAE